MEVSQCFAIVGVSDRLLPGLPPVNDRFGGPLRTLHMKGENLGRDTLSMAHGQ